jgi:NAD(P)-dependent dehydrogenase (short-subunit alcohol dehydrogenase family)
MKKIIVTGANRGIGLEICRQLILEGHGVILTARNESQGKHAAKEVGADFMKLDIADEKSIKSFIQEFQKNHDSLDVLINNAGILLDQKDKALNVNFANVYQTMETNTYGPWRLIIGLLDQLKKSDDPRVVNISSELGAISEMSGGYPSYRLSKVSMNAMTLMLTAELGDEITVNAMCPGW